MRRRNMVLLAAFVISLSGVVGCQQIVDQKVQEGKQRAKQELRQQQQKIERKARQGRGNVKQELKKAEQDIKKVEKQLEQGQ